MPLETATTIKIGLYFLTGVSTYLALSSPSGVFPAPKEKIGHVAKESASRTSPSSVERHIQRLCFILKTAVWSLALINSFATYVAYRDWDSEETSLILSYICNKPLSSCLPILLNISPVLSRGTLLSVSAALLRYWSFKNLGSNFTYVVPILQSRYTLTTDRPWYCFAFAGSIGASWIRSLPLISEAMARATVDSSNLEWTRVEVFHGMFTVVVYSAVLISLISSFYGMDLTYVVEDEETKRD
ncbi:hypothetical protein C8Q75DRAFT_803730 [Abortiporus biennis]|nr:hypothetical protein C8Q75DRAFT_803730 [Abortiporus biennis]